MKVSMLLVDPEKLPDSREEIPFVCFRPLFCCFQGFILSFGLPLRKYCTVERIHHATKINYEGRDYYDN